MSMILHPINEPSMVPRRMITRNQNHIPVLRLKPRVLPPVNVKTYVPVQIKVASQPVYNMTPNNASPEYKANTHYYAADNILPSPSNTWTSSASSPYSEYGCGTTSSSDHSYETDVSGEQVDLDTETIGHILAGKIPSQINQQKPKQTRQRLTNMSTKDKQERRKWRNRVAAQTARDRKKERTCLLEDAIKKLIKENDALKKSNVKLLRENQSLKNNQSQTYVPNSSCNVSLSSDNVSVGPFKPAAFERLLLRDPALLKQTSEVEYTANNQLTTQVTGMNIWTCWIFVMTIAMISSMSKKCKTSSTRCSEITRLLKSLTTLPNKLAPTSSPTQTSTPRISWNLSKKAMNGATLEKILSLINKQHKKTNSSKTPSSFNKFMPRRQSVKNIPIRRAIKNYKSTKKSIRLNYYIS